MATHKILGDEVTLKKRDNSRYWQFYTCLNGVSIRRSTKEEGLAQAKDVAEDWFYELKLKQKTGELKSGKTFADAAKKFRKDFVVFAQNEGHNAKYVETVMMRLDVHVLPYFGKKFLSDVTPKLCSEYRIHRMTSRVDKKTGKPKRPAAQTLNSEMVVIRHVLQTAFSEGWIKAVPDLRPPYRAKKKIVHRSWFSREEYQDLYEATRERAANPPKPRWKWACEQLHDFVLFVGNTGLRPDEAWQLQFRDVQIVKDQESDQEILKIYVNGKNGEGWCLSMPGAVLPFRRLCQRERPKELGRRQTSHAVDEADEITMSGKTGLGSKEALPAEEGAKSRLPKPHDLLFPKHHRELFNEVLNDLNLRRDRAGRLRTFYSLRHSYICFRLLARADIYQLAKNCRTSVEIIQKYYAAHIRHLVDASAVNTPLKRVEGPRRPSEADART